MPGPGEQRPPVERRVGGDRRSHPTRWLSRYWLRGRRRGGRRAGDAGHPYVDRYSWTDLLLVGGIILLCAADTLLTMRVVEAGAIEANPLMAALLGHGSTVFGAVKLGFTVLGMLFLLTHIRMRRVRALTICVLGLYAALMFWHLWVSWDMHQTLLGAAGT